MRRRETRRRRRRIQLMYRRRFTDSLPPFREAASGNPLRLEDPATSASPRAGFGMPRTAEITRKTSTHPIARDGVDRRTGRKVALEPGERARLRGSRFVA